MYGLDERLLGLLVRVVDQPNLVILVKAASVNTIPEVAERSDLPDAAEDTLDGRPSTEEKRIFVPFLLRQIARIVQVPPLRGETVQHMDDEAPRWNSL